ncbi:espG family protein [Mycobacteroides abscessus subsp. bolletii 1513]|uniref:EspG family protein n=1 Tax=Mycobacteroides abscessus subsp. bolletii 1513 TaxID=1299321 RepID=X8DTM1_9MYCO|nr:espG family protein [Mycobacteroides abscessus subsp. bolletii 1513]
MGRINALGAHAPDRAMDQANRSPDAVELTVDQAWFLADTLSAGTFPWVLAITVPFRDEAQRAGFNAQRVQELTRAGVLGPDGTVDPAVAGWIRTVCRPDRWLELRYVAAGSENPDVMRGIIARKQSQGRAQTVVSLRNAHLITFTVVDADDSSALVPSVVAGLRWRAPARFPSSPCPPMWAPRPTSNCVLAPRWPMSWDTWVSPPPLRMWWNRRSSETEITLKWLPDNVTTRPSRPQRLASAWSTPAPGESSSARTARVMAPGCPPSPPGHRSRSQSPSSS